MREKTQESRFEIYKRRRKMTENKCVWNGITKCEGGTNLIGAENCIECLANRMCKLEGEK